MLIGFILAQDGALGLVPLKATNVLSSWASISFSTTNLLHGVIYVSCEGKDRVGNLPHQKRHENAWMTWDKVLPILNKVIQTLRVLYVWYPSHGTMSGPQSRLDVGENTKIPASSGDQAQIIHPAGSQFTDEARPRHKSDFFKIRQSNFLTNIHRLYRQDSVARELFVGTAWIWSLRFLPLAVWKNEGTDNTNSRKRLLLVRENIKLAYCP